MIDLIAQYWTYTHLDLCPTEQKSRIHIIIIFSFYLIIDLPCTHLSSNIFRKRLLKYHKLSLGNSIWLPLFLYHTSHYKIPFLSLPKRHQLYCRRYRKPSNASKVHQNIYSYITITAKLWCCKYAEMTNACIIST